MTLRDYSEEAFISYFQCSCEAYVYALLKGCRCLEIDTWDGVDEPMVTHGMTLTTKIRLRDVLEVIKAYAFDASPYPVILSLENHCSNQQQTMMAMQFNTIFGDMLATENLSEGNTLPSPEKLKYKVILKGRFTSIEERGMLPIYISHCLRRPLLTILLPYRICHQEFF